MDWLGDWLYHLFSSNCAFKHPVNEERSISYCHSGSIQVFRSGFWLLLQLTDSFCRLRWNWQHLFGKNVHCIKHEWMYRGWSLCWARGVGYPVTRPKLPRHTICIAHIFVSCVSWLTHTERAHCTYNVSRKGGGVHLIYVPDGLPVQCIPTQLDYLSKKSLIAYINLYRESKGGK